MLKLRTYSYSDKASICHIDRRQAFRRKFLGYQNLSKNTPKRGKHRLDEKF